MGGNKITDVSVADTLSSCPNLHHLVLAGNSIERAPKYHLVVAAMIPQLESLDGETVDTRAKAKVSNGMILEAASAMQLEQEELDDERRMEMALMGDDMCFGSMTGSSEISGKESPFHNISSYVTGETNCSLPDNGSDLTHGSAVVLAGSMASAIRRRRNGSPRASSSHSQEDNDMSTLATLDSAHHDFGTKSSDQYFGEGDITKAMQQGDKTLKTRMASSPKSSQYRQKKKAPASMSLDVNISTSNLNDNPHTPRNLSNPIAAAIISAAHNQNAMSFDYDSGEERNAKSGVSGTTPAGWASRPLSRHLSRRGSSRSPSPSTRNNSSAEGRKPPKSPPTWQRNASRPQSTASSARGSTSHGIAGGIAPSAPFKVTLNTENDGQISPCPSPLNPTSKVNDNAKGKEVLPNLSRRNKDRSVGPLWDDSSGAGDSDSDSDSELRGRNQRRVRGVGPPPSSGAKGLSSNVVKKDNVLRGLLFSDEPIASEEGIGMGTLPLAKKRDAGFSFEYKDDDDDDDEDENFSSDRKSRHEFMRLEQKERVNNKQKQKQMMAFPKANDGPASPRVDLHSSHSHKSVDDDIQESSINLSDCIQPSEQTEPERDSSVSGKQLSQVATRSLGFDLKGSLAAINQWVDDQDSDDDDEEEENENVPSTSKYGDVWSMRNEIKRATTAQKKILSRDKILGMCTGHLEDGNPRSRLTADNLAINEYHSGGYSYDQEDDEESDCEENEVMFYDNNIDKTSNSLSKSCSLLTIGGFGDGDDKTKKPKNDKKLMSMSLKIDSKPKPSPKPKKRVAKVDDSKKSTSEDITDHRGCTPSTNVHVDAQTSVATPQKNSLEADVRNSPSNIAREIENAAKSKKKSGDKVKIEVASEAAGDALALSDEQLVYMLSQPPKAVPSIKTKSGFQGFFRGMPEERMRDLLREAYKDMTDLDRDNKVKKRMELLGDVLTN